MEENKKILDSKRVGSNLICNLKDAKYITPLEHHKGYESIKSLAELKELEKKIYNDEFGYLDLLDLLNDKSKEIRNIELYKWLNLEPFNHSRLALLGGFLGISLDDKLDPRGINRAKNYLNTFKSRCDGVFTNDLTKNDLKNIYGNGYLLPDGIDTIAKYAYCIFNANQYAFNEEGKKDIHYKMGTTLYFEYYDYDDSFKELMNNPECYQIKCLEDDNKVLYFGNSRYTFYIENYSFYKVTFKQLMKNYSIHLGVDAVNGKHMLVHLYLDKGKEHSIDVLKMNEYMSKQSVLDILQNINLYLKSINLREIRFKEFYYNPLSPRKGIFPDGFDDYTNEGNSFDEIHERRINDDYCLKRADGVKIRAYANTSYGYGSIVKDEEGILYTVDNSSADEKLDVVATQFKSFGRTCRHGFIDPLINTEEWIAFKLESYEENNSLTLDNSMFIKAMDNEAPKPLEKEANEVYLKKPEMDMDKINKLKKDYKNELNDISTPSPKFDNISYQKIDFAYATEDEVGPLPDPLKMESAFDCGGYKLRDSEAEIIEVLVEFDKYTIVLGQSYDSIIDYVGTFGNSEDVNPLWNKLVGEVKEGRHSMMGRDIKRIILRSAGSINTDTLDNIVKNLESDKKLCYNSSYDEFYKRAKDMLFIYKDEVYDLTINKKYFRYGSYNTIDSVDKDDDYYDDLYSPYISRYDKDFDIVGGNLYSYLNKELDYEFPIKQKYKNAYILDEAMNEAIYKLDNYNTKALFTLKDAAYTKFSEDSYKFDQDLLFVRLKKPDNREKYKLYVDNKYFIDSLSSIYKYRQYLAGVMPNKSDINAEYSISRYDCYEGRYLYGEKTFKLDLNFNSVKFFFGHVSGKAPGGRDLKVKDLVKLFLNENALNLVYGKYGLSTEIFTRSEEAYAMCIKINGYKELGLSEMDVVKDYKLQVEFDAINGDYCLFHMYLAKKPNRSLTIVKYDKKTSPVEVDKLVYDVNSYCIDNLGYYLIK